jgi:hypothetical protein
LRKNAFLLGVFIVLTGCSEIYQPKPTITPVTDETVMSRTASLSNVYVLDKQTDFVTCAEPPPDAVFTQSDAADFSFSLVQLGGDDKGDNKEQSQEVSMVGRTPGVLMARELFYRACEFSRNYELSKEEAISLYRETLKTVSNGWQVEGGNTTVRIDESDAISSNQRLFGLSDTAATAGTTARPGVRPSVTSSRRTTTPRPGVTSRIVPNRTSPATVSRPRAGPTPISPPKAGPTPISPPKAGPTLVNPR